MRKIQIKWVIGLVIPFIFSCFNSRDMELRPFSKQSITDKEDNDSFKTANEATSQSPLIGFYNKKSGSADKDYYKVIFPSRNTSFKIILTGVPGIDAKLTLFNPSQAVILRLDEGLIGESEKLWEYYPTYDYIYLLVESKLNYNEKVPYVINFIPKSIDKTNETEPNNSKENAVLMKIGDDKQGFISPKDDVDYYKIVFDDEKAYDFSIKLETLSNLDVSLTIINEKTGEQKHINSFSWGGGEYFPFLSNAKGEYYLKINGNIKSNDRKNPLYYLKIDPVVKDESDKEKEIYYEREFNNTKEQATGLINTSDIEGVFYPESDEDWYSFELYKKPISVDLSLSRIRGIDPIIEIYNTDNKLIQVINNNKVDGGEEMSLTDLDKGRYYIRLYSKESSLLIYKLFFNIRY